MAASLPDVVDVVKSYACLRDDERIMGGFDNFRNHPWLKIIDAGLHEEDIISPSRNNGIAAYAAMTIGLEK